MRLALEAVAAAVSPTKREAWLAQSQEHVDEWRKETETARASEKVPMWPERLCKEADRVPAEGRDPDRGHRLRRALDRDARLSQPPDAALLPRRRLARLVVPGLARREVRRAGPAGHRFTGDGGFYYHLPELETARRRGIKTVTVVNNNRCLAQGVRNLTIAYGSHDKTNMGECYEYRNTDFAKVAQAFDCFGVTVEKPQDFRKAFDAAMASDLPAVIDVKTEPGLQAPLVWAPA